MTELYSLVADVWKMDGGVAFGVIPKSLWNRGNIADAHNMIPIVDRCLLVKTGNRLILIDTGMGNKQKERYYEVRYREPGYSLLSSLNEAGFSPDEVTDILFTHLHDDHAGGATYRVQDEIRDVFPKAVYYCSKEQWEWAMHPNKREGASYFPENLLPLQNTGRLKFIVKSGDWIPGIRLAFYHGHTMGQIIPFIRVADRTVVFMGDFIPTTLNLPTAFIPAVDIQPLLSMQEKTEFLRQALENEWVLFFEHDYLNECCTLKESEKGPVVDRCFSLREMRNQ